jgi:hypothetical protein
MVLIFSGAVSLGVATLERMDLKSVYQRLLLCKYCFIAPSRALYSIQLPKSRFFIFLFPPLVC